MFSELVTRIRTKVEAALSQQEGQGMVEYGLIIALVAVVVIAMLTLLGTHLQSLFSSIANSLNT